MKVVITGGAGFIGANLCRELLRRHDYQVVVVDNMRTGRPANLAGLDVDLHTGSVLDHRVVAAACRGADSIVHLADTDLAGTTTVLDVARDTGAHVVIGSDAAAYQASVGLERCVFRISHVFGPFQHPNRRDPATVPSFIFNALHGLPLTIYGDGEQTRHFTFAASAAEVLAEAVASRLTGVSTVDLAFGTRATINEVVTILSDLLGRRLEVCHRPPRAGDLRHPPADAAVVPALFPKLRPVPLAHGLVRTLSWLESRVMSVPVGHEVPA